MPAALPHRRVAMRKWPDAPHWEFDAVALGRDEHGQWLGIRTGTRLASPARAFDAVADHVTLVPDEAWWVATFYDVRVAHRPFDVYVDITTPPSWPSAELVTCVDLDLDVIRGTSGRVFVDDEDEFAEHQVSLGYPTDVVAGALASCEAVEAGVCEQRPPFDPATCAQWLDAFAARVGR